MSESLVLELLRAMRGDIVRIHDRLDEHGLRLGRIEMALAGLHVEFQRRLERADG